MIRKAITSLLTASLLGAFLFLVTGTASAQQTFSNTAPITINDNAPGSPYPSNIAVTGLTGSVSKVTVTLNGVGHTFPDDVDILLVSPGGQKALVMSDVGGSGDITGVNLTFDDAATATITDGGPITAGTYKPSNVDTTTDVFPAPAPAAPYATDFNTFIGSTPNGTWSLYVRDDIGTDLGSIAGGWSITLTTVVGPGTLQFNAATFTGSERSTATVTVTRAGGFDGAVAVNYATSGGTATGGAACGSGVDYVTTSGTLNFAVGELSRTFTVQLCEDTVADDNETFNVTLSAPTGGATVGTPGTATVTIRDCSQIAYATTLRFPSAGVTENHPTNILSDVAVQGLDTTLAEYLQSIDFRPANGQLYGLIVQNNAAAGASGTVRLVTVNPTTGATTAVGTPFTTPNPGNFTGFDFNPVADRIRVTRILSAARDANLRINPNDGVFTEDTPLAFAAGDPNAGDDEFIVASAYTNSVAGATSTTLYNIDSSQDLLVRQGGNPGNTTPSDPGNPNSGILNTIGPLGVNTSGITGFDIASNGTAYAVLDTSLGTGGFGGAGRLYTINLTTGAATLVGQVGGLSTRFTSSFAIAPGATPTAPIVSRADFDNDGRTDLSVFRDGNWFIQRSTAGFLAVQWGAAGDFLVPEDYNNDGITDFAIYRPTATTGAADFYVLNSTTNTFFGVEWGAPGDVARPGDFTGDGRADFAVHRASTNTYYVLPSDGTAPLLATFPGSGANLTPITLDYDGDGKTDLGAWNSTTGVWTIRQSQSGTVINIQWGQAGDLLVPADYDNDNRDDLAVFRNGTWFARRTSNGQLVSIPFGQTGDVPVPGDYDGDGADDQAVFRGGLWFILQSSNSSVRSAAFGAAADRPVPAGYLP
jgi:subtilisin-like proprotein convertase family protein